MINSTMSAGLLTWSWTILPPTEDVVMGAMRLAMMFWKTTVSRRPPAQLKVAPASSCRLVSGDRPGLPKIVVPIGVSFVTFRALDRAEIERALDDTLVRQARVKVHVITRIVAHGFDDGIENIP